MRLLSVSRIAAVWMAVLILPFGQASAETIFGAMAKAYSRNPSLNAQRAGTRAVDEAVAIAKSGYRPRVNLSADIGYTHTTTNGFSTKLTPGGFGVSISQTLYDWNRTRNSVQSAEAAVLASRETLRNVEQNVLFDAASAFMDVRRDAAIASIRLRNLEFLEEEVRAARTRFDVGESTRTDVAQAEARRAAAVAELNAARATLKSSGAVYRQVVGTDPSNLKPGNGVVGLLPAHLNRALGISAVEHPAIKATLHLVDQAGYDVKAAQSELLPTLSLSGSATRGYDRAASGAITDSTSVSAALTVPIYQGGAASGVVRQRKETLGQRRIEVDQSRDNVRAAVVSAHSQLEAARASVFANHSQLRAARLALSGAVEERNVGQRTTLDVLNTQQDVLSAQISLAQSERDQIVAEYALLSAVGRLSARTLNLKVASYQVEEHYEAVVDKWFGLRTPDQR